MINFTAKKSLGQNFLHAPHVISAMVHAAHITPEDTVIEVGPGKGALTEKLLATGAHIIAIEKDDRAIPFLSEKFAHEIQKGTLKIIHGDTLVFDPSTEGLQAGKYKVVANIPYYITGEFMRKFLSEETPPSKMVVMVQKEVARRITDTKESILSIATKVYGDPTFLISVPRKFFRPVPNVDSAVLTVQNISKKFFLESKIPETTFFDIVKAAFAHKRKVVKKNLEAQLPKETIEKIWEKFDLPKKARAEDIGVEMWKKIVGEAVVS